MHNKLNSVYTETCSNITKQNNKIANLEKEKEFLRDIVENIDEEGNREKDFKIEELVFKIENYNHIYLSLKQKLASVKSDIEKERNKLLSRNTRKAKTTDILRSQKMKRVKSAYETDEMVPIHESDKFIKYHDNFVDN